MENLFNLFLIIHIISGTIGLLVGTIILVKNKGDKIHKKVGKLFSISMLVTGFSALIIATLHNNKFLFAVGVFTIFLTATGWRYLYLKNILQGQKVQIVDWLLTIIMILFSSFLIYWGIVNLSNKQFFGIVPILFGWRGISFAISDYKIYKGNITIKNYWLINHLQRMLGAYIAALTAFLVVNAPNSLGFIVWLLPSIIIVPFIIKWTRKYKQLI